MKRYIICRVYPPDPRRKTRNKEARNKEAASSDYRGGPTTRRALVAGRAPAMSAAAGDGALLEGTAKAEEDIRDVFRLVS